MGTKNRERRKAKQRARREQHRQPGGDAFGPPGDDPFGFGRPRMDAYTPEARARVTIVAAVRGLASGDAVAFERHLDDLLTGPGGASGQAAVNQGLLDILVMTVDSVWQSGWQPTELRRLVVKRGNGGQAGVLDDAMAAAMRPHAAATVDERWEAQLRALDAKVWWQRDDTYFDELARLAGADRSDAIRTGLELLGALSFLPVIPTLLPPPGKGRRGALAPDPRRDVDQRMLEKVRGLLAKAESTTFEAEAETYTAKAQELMARHSIDYAVLAAQTGSKDEPVSRRMAIDNPYEAEKATLLGVVAGANRSQTVWSEAFGFVTVFGFANDLDSIEVLFTSLLVQATRAMTSAGQQRDAYGRSRTRSFRQSFLTGFAHRIGDRLMLATETATTEAEAEAGAGSALLPVLAHRDEQVREAVFATFPDVYQRRGPRISNAHGFHSGVAAADRASLQVHEALAE